MSACRRIQKKLSAYQDGEVGSVQKAAVENHLRTCKACQKHYAALRHTYQLLKSVPDMEADDGLTFRILDRVMQPRETLWIRIKDNFHRVLPAPAAMAVLVVAGIFFGALAGGFWIQPQYLSTRAPSAFSSEPGPTLASLKAFDAAPSGSFSEGYLQLITYGPETRYEK